MFSISMRSFSVAFLLIFIFIPFVFVIQKTANNEAVLSVVIEIEVILKNIQFLAF